VSANLQYDLPEDPGEGSGETPELPAPILDEAALHPDLESGQEADNADSINVDEPGEDTETGGV
jgi:hypothetical protein